MKFKKNRKALVAIAVVLALVIAASATFAWVTSKNQIPNKFENEGFAASDGLIAIEDETEFKFEVGMKTPKNVRVLNTGSAGMLARVTFEEMIKLLGNGGTITYTGSNAAAAGFEPVPFDMDTISAWTAVNPGDITWTGTAPTGITVKAANITAENPQFAVVYTDGAGKAWLAKFGDSTTYTKSTGKITDAAVEYAYYTTGTAVFDSWDDAHNYAAWNALYDPLASIAGKPAAANIYKSTVGAGEVDLVYGAAFSTVAPVGNTDTWIYWDGYFYYMKVIPGGGYTEKLLTDVGLDLAGVLTKDDLKKWQKYEYTLVVCVEGLQATEEALVDTTASGTAAGWQLNATADAALIAALKAAIAAA
ncbi:MAG: hypothetical protein FWC27_06550 [Firmicutes bacterium]|nr:hypothetical protein [Bacillota bacterium]